MGTFQPELTEATFLSFLPFNEINNLRTFKVVSGFESRPSHRAETVFALPGGSGPFPKPKPLAVLQTELRDRKRSTRP